MGKYLDFENHEKGYKKLELSIQNFKDNIGKKICFVNSRSIDPYRGYYNVDYGVIESTRYNTIYFENGNQIDLRDIRECGIKIE